MSASVPSPSPSGSPRGSGGDRLAKLLRLLESDPSDTFCLYGIAQEHASRGAHAEATEWFDRVIEHEPSHGYAYFHKARAEEALGRIDAAIATLRAGLAASAGDPKAASEIAGYLASLDE